VPADLVADIRDYAEMVEDLPSYDEREEVLNLFILREVIEEELHRGAVPSPADLKRLEAADTVLAKHRARVLRRFPELFDPRPEVPRAYWWWYLDEAPRPAARARSA